MTPFVLTNGIITSHKFNSDGSESISMTFEEEKPTVNISIDKEILKKAKNELETYFKGTSFKEEISKKIDEELAKTELKYKTEPELKVCDSISVKIFMAGDYHQARKILNDYCFRNGCCVNLVENTYIYSAGEEKGFIVELINYARFPKTVDDLEKQTYTIACLLRENLNQDSFSIQTLWNGESKTRFYSWRHLRNK